jgi:uncharacterized repeat protein (TIGR03803 family)
MRSRATNREAQGRLNISKDGLIFRPLKLATAAAHGALTLAALTALLFVAAGPAQAQTEAMLYNFSGDPDGANPLTGLTSDGVGNFYGTTSVGGLGLGTVFELSPNGNGGWNETVIYSFCSAPNCADGANPAYSGVILDGKGNLYGTTEYGGATGLGVVFELSPVEGGWSETVLHNFCVQSGCPDGANPLTGVAMDTAGNLYGTNGLAVFELRPSDGRWIEQTILGAAGTSWLTIGATKDVFVVQFPKLLELSRKSNGSWTSTVIYTFGDVGTIQRRSRARRGRGHLRHDVRGRHCGGRNSLQAESRKEGAMDGEDSLLL